MPPVSAAPVPAPAPATEAGGQPSTGLEPCPHCGTPLALDQRYCLECGAPRTYLSGMLLERLRAPDAQSAPAQAPPPSPYAPPVPGGATGTLASSTPAGSATWQRGSVLTLIAGIGVLLLAMGVGVLIGRSGGTSSSSGAAPQIVTVPAAASGAASTTTTPTTPEASSSAKAGAAAAAAAAKHKATSGAPSSGVGSSLSKPAPPSVAEHERGGSGQSYEQKSKNLPNVVSTG
jgi:zinc-ribbon domain